MTDQIKRWRQENPDAVRAHRTVYSEIRAGRLVRPENCERCLVPIVGKRRLHAHHIDYSRPLQVQWLCVRCHGKETRRANREWGRAVAKETALLLQQVKELCRERRANATVTIRCITAVREEKARGASDEDALKAATLWLDHIEDKFEPPKQDLTPGVAGWRPKDPKEE